MKNRLYGSSATLEGITNIINQFWCRKESVILEQVTGTKKEIYNINLGAKLAEGCQVRKQGKRYHFEEVE